jgi:hypothetical protein
MKSAISAAAVALLLSGCATRQVTMAALSTNNLVEVPQVISALKCAFAQGLEQEKAKSKRHRLSGNVADVTLGLQVVDTSGMSADAKAIGPAILALGSGGSVTPNINGSYTVTNTVKTTIKFRLSLTLDKGFPSACEHTPAKVRRAYGFEDWLSSVINGLEPNADFAPVGELDSIQFNGAFGVEKKAGAGADYNVVFVSGNAGATAGRNDVQTLDFTIEPASDKVKRPRADDQNRRALRALRPF